jgi:hypothetical protein
MQNQRLAGSLRSDLVPSVEPEVRVKKLLLLLVLVVLGAAIARKVRAA